MFNDADYDNNGYLGYDEQKTFWQAIMPQNPVDPESDTDEEDEVEWDWDKLDTLS